MIYNDTTSQGDRTEEYVGSILKLSKKALGVKLATLLNELLKAPGSENSSDILHFVMEAYEDFTGGQFWEDYENTKCQHNGYCPACGK